jgi:hypothetical protein
VVVVAVAGCGGEDKAAPPATTSTRATAPVPSIDELEAGLGQEGLPEDVRCRRTGERDFVCRFKFTGRPIQTKRVHIASDGSVITTP